MNITNIENFAQRCTGCGVCANICSKNLIQMVQDEEGFWSPKVNLSDCHQCGDCVNHCILQTPKKSEKNFQQSVYALQIKDKDMLLCSTAGGFFQLLAKKVASIGGVVYGCRYDNKMQAIHKGETSDEGLRSFSGSKYVQSNTTAIFPEILDSLKSRKVVLFSGTPCQVDAVHAYCRFEDCSRLITVDVPCYGVPSPKLFLAYIEKLNRLYDGKVIDFRFRDKRTYGWSHTVLITIQKADGSIFEIEECDHSKIDYYKMFAMRNCFRKSCYNCMYNTTRRVSDFTTGNYWNIENKSDVFDHTKGVSMLIVNSEKGKKLFDKMLDDMIIEKRTLDDAIASNDAIVVCSVIPKQRNAIYKTFNKKGFDVMFKKYYTPNRYQALKSYVKKIIRQRGMR